MLFCKFFDASCLHFSVPSGCCNLSWIELITLSFVVALHCWITVLRCSSISRLVYSQELWFGFIHKLLFIGQVYVYMPIDWIQYPGSLNKKGGMILYKSLFVTKFLQFVEDGNFSVAHDSTLLTKGVASLQLHIYFTCDGVSGHTLLFYSYPSLQGRIRIYKWYIFWEKCCLSQAVTWNLCLNSLVLSGIITLCSSGNRFFAGLYSIITNSSVIRVICRRYCVMQTNMAYIELFVPFSFLCLFFIIIVLRGVVQCTVFHHSDGHHGLTHKLLMHIP